MNYRHIYHAGNFADVFKHIVLMLVLEYLGQKDKPYFVLDTHAGIGLYDLMSEEAGKTGEGQAGVGRLLERTDAPEAVKRYLKIVRGVNRKGGGVRFYPGSPLIVREMLREGDRFVANELHPEDVWTLRQNLGESAQMSVEHKDGYLLLKALLPPPERRGAVLIDPPFEVRNEFELMVKGLREAHKRFATGTYIFWYPIKDPKIVAAFHRELKETGIPRITAIDFMARPAEDLSKFNGTGLAIVNPPWTLTEQAREIMPWLVDALTNGRGSFAVTEIAGEG